MTPTYEEYSVVAPSLAPGFKYGKVDPKDFALVKSRTQIPRQDRTMRKLPSVAISYRHFVYHAAANRMGIPWTGCFTHNLACRVSIQRSWIGQKSESQVVLRGDGDVLST
jgi:hypothetical protein